MTIYPQPKPLPAAPKRKDGPRTARAQAKDRALEAWKVAVKDRAGNVCEMAGKYHACGHVLDGHHVVGKGRAPRLALDQDNGVALCRVAHDLLHRARWFKPYFWAWFFGKFPGRRERLLQKAQKEARLA